jgi:hypothetical protein
MRCNFALELSDLGLEEGEVVILSWDFSGLRLSDIIGKCNVLSFKHFFHKKLPFSPDVRFCRYYKIVTKGEEELIKLEEKNESFTFNVRKGSMTVKVMTEVLIK